MLSLQVKEGRILLYLKKVSAVSWYPELSDGLDAYDEEAEQRARELEESKNGPESPEEKESLPLEPTAPAEEQDN